KLEVIKKGTSVLFLLLVIPFGVWGAVYASVISMLIHAIVNTYYSGQLIGYPIVAQWRDLVPVLSIGICCFLCVYWSNILILNTLSLVDIIIIISNLTIYFVTFSLFSYIFNVRGMWELKGLLIKLKSWS